MFNQSRADSAPTPPPQAKPYKNQTDGYLAVSCSFALLAIFICSIIYKCAARGTNSCLLTCQAKSSSPLLSSLPRLL